VLAVSSIYGIDIQVDNVEQCRTSYWRSSKEAMRPFSRVAQNLDASLRCQFILKRNIIWGDALTLKTIGPTPEHITFSEWSPSTAAYSSGATFTYQASWLTKIHGNYPYFSELGDDFSFPFPRRNTLLSISWI